MPTRHTGESTGTKKVILIRNADQLDFGGGERVPVDLAVELAKNEYQPFIISRSKKLLEYASVSGMKSSNGWWWSRQNWSGLKMLLVPIYIVWQILLTVWYLQLFIRLRPDVVHPQSKDDFIAATIAGKLVGAKIIWSDHADLKYVYQNVRIWYKNPVAKLVRFCSRRAKAIILTSDSDKKLIENELGSPLPANYIVIHNGIKDTLKTGDRGREDKKIVFAATSRLVIEKGIGELIKAFTSVRKNFPTAELWLFGEGPEEAKFKKMASGQQAILFKGFPADALEQVSLADIFVHPSYLEGFSISLLEAAMLGKPIIACRVGGNPEIVKDGKNGILISPRNSEELAQAMEKLAASKKLRDQYGKVARREYEKNFVLDKIVKEKYVPLYG